MAEGSSEDNNSWESWLGGWVQTAKEKSSTALEFVKRDLAEFSSVIQQETEKAIEKTSSSLTRENTEQATTKVKAGISSFLGNISKALVIPPSDEYVPVCVSADGTTFYDRGRARLHAIQLDASTYVDPPRGQPEQFEMWLNSFDMDTHKGEISEILVSKVEVRALYTKLVPNEVSHAEFWQRYFYRVHQLECDEERKKALMQRAERSHGDSLSWDEDDWSGSEEDDGNQSDWEKMPRPHQRTASSDPSSKLDQSSSIKDTPPKPSTSDTSLSTQPTSSTQPPPTDPPSVDTNSTPHPQLQRISLPQVSNSTSCDKGSASVSATEDLRLEPVDDHFAHNTSDSSKAESSQVMVADTAEANLCIQMDTACASTPEERVPSEDIQVQEPGSQAEVPEREGSHDEVGSHIRPNLSASSAAAASGSESSPVVEEGNNVTGDAACGAADGLSSPTPSLPPAQPTVNSPHAVSDATPASTEKLDVPNGNDSTTPVEPSEDNASSTPVVPQESSQPTASDSDDNVSVKADGDPGLPMRVKGDMVVVGETDTPSSDSSEAKGLDDDWDEDFDVEVTEEDLKAAEDIAKKLGENLDAEDDWENWD